MSMPARRYIGSSSSWYWMPPATCPSTSTTSRTTSPSPRRSCSIATTGSGFTHHRATDGSAWMSCSRRASSGPPGRSLTRRPARTGGGPPGLPGGITEAVLVRVLIQPALQLVVDRELGGRQARAELLRAARPDDGRGDRLVGQHPGDREGDQAHPGLVGQPAEGLDRVELAVVPVAVLVHLPGGAEGEARALRGRVGAGVLAGQQAAGDRVVGDDADALLAAVREHFPLDLAEEQVVPRLYAVEAGQPQRLGPADGSHELIDEEVRAADVADLPLVDQVVEGAEGLIDRRLEVVPVELVEVDVVGLQAPQGGLDGGEDVLAGVAAVEGRRPGRGEALGGDDEPVPPAVQPAPEDLLGNSPGGQLPAQRVGVG